MSKSLKKRAKHNLSVTKKHGDGSVEEVKKGSVVDASVLHPVPNTTPTIGMAKGVTKNMGDFESLRVDVWLSAPVESGKDITEAYKELEEVIDGVLESTVMEYMEDE